MAIGNILVAFSGNDRDAAALRTALRLARRYSCHVDALHANLDPRDAVAFAGEGMTAAMIEQIMAAAENESAQALSRARQRFNLELKSAAVMESRVPPPTVEPSAFLVVAPGREDELMAERGRLADLIVVARPSPSDEAISTLTLDACLRDTGRMVLVMPDGAPEFGRQVAIGWNGSIEAGRAVGAALPFLAAADRVTVLSVEEGRSYGPQGAAVVEYLAWHGISARAEVLTAGPFGSGRALLNRVAEINADFLVMGAYTRGHMRRLLFGGVTGEVLAHIPVPVLMLH